MIIAISIIHVIVCIALILIILFQAGKGADMGAIFGGGSANTLFGSSGAGGFLSKLTTAAAIVFMITCITLAYISSHRRTLMSSGQQAPQHQTSPNPAGKPPAIPPTGSGPIAPAGGVGQPAGPGAAPAAPSAPAPVKGGSQPGGDEEQ